MNNLTEIEAYIQVCMIQGINKVINGEEKNVKLYYVRPDDVVTYLESIDLECDTDELEANGWQWDYWQKITFKDKNYTLSGDGYSDNHAKFSIDE